MDQILSQYTPTLTNFLKPPPQDFETKILWLVQRYISILPPPKKFKIIQPNNNHHTLHPEITKVLIESFNITHSYYSSQFACPIQLMHYNSPHNHDIIYKSLGQAKSSKWKGIGLTYPTDHNTTLEAIHWARMTVKEDTHIVTILIVNHNDQPHNNSQSPRTQRYTYIATIPPHITQYDPTPTWPRYYQRTEPSLTSIICIHNQTHQTMKLQTPHTLQIVLIATINTHIDMYPIKPTPTKYHVRISKVWKDTPKTSTHI